MLGILNSILNFLQKVVFWITVMMVLILVITNSINLIGRTFFGFSLNDVIELSRLLLVYITMLGIFGAFRNRKYIRMDILERKLNKKQRIYLNIFIECIILSFLFFVIPSSMALAIKQMVEHMPGLLVPRGFVPLGVLIGAVLLSFNGIHEILKNINLLRDKSNRII